MSAVSIKVNIANRDYPMKISGDEQDLVRKAAKLIEQKIKEFEQAYAVKDKQDVLAMCALQFAAESEQTKINKNSLSNALEQRLVDLNQRLEQHLDADVL